MNIIREEESNPADYEGVGMLTDKLNEANAEITRLRALAVRPKRIEWKLCKSGTMFGCFKPRTWVKAEIVFHVREEINGYWSYKIRPFNIFQTDFHTREAAMESCQSAFDAWIGQFMEVGE